MHYIHKIVEPNSVAIMFNVALDKDPSSHTGLNTTTQTQIDMGLGRMCTPLRVIEQDPGWDEKQGVAPLLLKTTSMEIVFV